MNIFDTNILLPMLCMIGLTFFTFLYMYFTRINYMRANRISAQLLRDRNGVRQTLQPVSAPANHLNNLLELPPLFYFASILIWLLQLADAHYLALCWLFVLLRFTHSAIHLSYNRVMHRFIAFSASSLVLLLIWLRLALQIIQR